MSPSTTQKKQRSSKLFQCSGYGDCKMVFTRGEHLARHKRKHTGEKPFPCIVPDCSKSFSRFDNMMQHTQTHRKDPQRSELRQQHQQQYQNQFPMTSLPSRERNDKVVLHQPSSTTTSMPYSSLQAQDSIASNCCLPEHHVGFESPISLVSASVMDSASSSDEEDEDEDEDDDDDEEEEENAQYYQHDGHAHWMDHPYRPLSVADMCNPMVAQQSLKIEQLTNDEVEVIQAFGKLRQATC